MITLASLKNTSRPCKGRIRVGRGPGSGKGKTCGRGEKGAGSRAGYKRRYGYEGGQFRMFMKLPIRGFSNARFRKDLEAVNLGQIEQMFKDGDVVNVQTLSERGFLRGKVHGLKILGKGELKKNVTIEADAVSRGAREKLQQSKIAFKTAE
ncbi:MAG: 50S ribosomal protein L15 [Parachlamydia sp.]|nr:50S ribosomal protein L15 [Parachlamydia sp.]